MVSVIINSESLSETDLAFGKDSGQPWHDVKSIMWVVRSNINQVATDR